MEMRYRRLGDAGVKVSQLSFGSWVSFHNQVDADGAAEIMGTAYDAGVNFFDNAEAYAGGESEKVMGQAIRDLAWPRHSYLVSTKFFGGIHEEAVNMRRTLNRKYLMQAIDGSLERLGLDFVDLVFCHRPDPDTPVRETVHAMHEIVTSGKALYWGTSEWSADEIRAAYDYAARHGLHRPQMEQPQYNLLERRTVERGYARLYEDCGLGLTTWSPLASGVLTGKYVDGIPEGSRATRIDWVKERASDAELGRRISALAAVAEDLGCSTAQLAIAWCAANPHVSTVILGATSVDQIRENLGAMEVVDAIDDAVRRRIDEALGRS